MKRLLLLAVCLFVIQATSGITQADSCPLYPVGFQGGFVTYYALHPNPACSTPHLFVGPYGLTSNCNDPATCFGAARKAKAQAKAKTRLKGGARDSEELWVGVDDIEIPEATVPAPWVKKVHTRRVYFILNSNHIYLQLHRVKCDPTDFDFPGLENEEAKTIIRGHGIKHFNFGHEVEPDNADDYVEIPPPTEDETVEEGFQYLIRYRGQQYPTLIQRRN